MEDQQLILEKLEELERLKLEKAFQGVRGPSPPEGGEFLPSSRFNFILSGSKEVTLPLSSGAETLQFDIGYAQCSLPDTWELHTWNTSHEMLCIVPNTEYLRISYYRVSGDEKHKINRFYHTPHAPHEAFKNIEKALNALPCLEDNEVDILLLKALVKLAIFECKQIDTSDDKASSTFNKVRIWMENSFSEDIDRETAARIFQLSPGYLSQLFSKKSDMSFHGYLTKCRIDFAKHLLKETNLTVYQVADQCGFKNNVHFVRRFREMTGVPPGKFRANYYAEKHK